MLSKERHQTATGPVHFTYLATWQDFDYAAFFIDVFAWRIVLDALGQAFINADQHKANWCTTLIAVPNFYESSTPNDYQKPESRHLSEVSGIPMTTL